MRRRAPTELPGDGQILAWVFKTRFLPLKLSHICYQLSSSKTGVLQIFYLVNPFMGLQPYCQLHFEACDSPSGCKPYFCSYISVRLPAPFINVMTPLGMTTLCLDSTAIKNRSHKAFNRFIILENLRIFKSIAYILETLTHF